MLLVSPFFFWGTSMVAMKGLAPHTTPLLVAAWRLIPAGAVLLVWAHLSGRRPPTQAMAWPAIALFGLIDGACFQARRPPFCLAAGRHPAAGHAT
jgi:drug/metabolite transporter (DMT)-like permease